MIKKNTGATRDAQKIANPPQNLKQRAQEAFRRYHNPSTLNGAERGLAYESFGTALGYTRVQDDEIAVIIQSDQSWTLYADRDCRRTARY